MVKSFIIMSKILREWNHGSLVALITYTIIIGSSRGDIGISRMIQQCRKYMSYISGTFDNTKGL